MAQKIPKGYVKLFFKQNLGRIDIRHYFKLPEEEDDDIQTEYELINIEGLNHLRSEGLIPLSPSQPGIYISLENAQKLASFWGRYAETLDKMNKI